MSVFTYQRFSRGRHGKKHHRICHLIARVFHHRTLASPSRAAPGSGKVRFCQVQWSRPGIYDCFCSQKHLPPFFSEVVQQTKTRNFCCLYYSLWFNQRKKSLMRNPGKLWNGYGICHTTKFRTTSECWKTSPVFNMNITMVDDCEMNSTKKHILVLKRNIPLWYSRRLFFCLSFLRTPFSEREIFAWKRENISISTPQSAATFFYTMVKFVNFAHFGLKGMAPGCPKVPWHFFRQSRQAKDQTKPRWQKIA